MLIIVMLDSVENRRTKEDELRILAFCSVDNMFEIGPNSTAFLAMFLFLYSVVSPGKVALSTSGD